jgi:cell division protein FtsL
VNKAELEQAITRLEEQESSQKFGLDNAFKNLEEELKPEKILQNLMKRGLSKVKSFLPKFTFRSNSGR